MTMDTRTLLAALVGGVVAFLLGWLIFGMLLMGWMEAHMLSYPGLMKTEEEMNLALMFLSNLCLALLLAWSFGRMGVNSLAGGLVTGAVVGFLFYLSVDLSFMAMMNLFDGPMAVVVDVAANTVWTAGVGGAVGFMLGRGAAKAG